jgi:hypothetical protein
MPDLMIPHVKDATILKSCGRAVMCDKKDAEWLAMQLRLCNSKPDKVLAQMRAWNKRGRITGTLHSDQPGGPEYLVLDGPDGPK